MKVDAQQEQPGDADFSDLMEKAVREVDGKRYLVRHFGLTEQEAKTAVQSSLDDAIPQMILPDWIREQMDDDWIIEEVTSTTLTALQPQPEQS